MKKIDFKLLPNILDYIFLLESKPEVQQDSTNKQPQAPSVTPGEPGTWDNYWWLYLNKQMMTHLNDAFVRKFSNERELETGIWIKTPFVKTVNLLSNNTLLYMLMIELDQLNLPTNDTTALTESVKNFLYLTPFFDQSVGEKPTKASFFSSIITTDPVSPTQLDLGIGGFARLNEYGGVQTLRVVTRDGAGNITGQRQLIIDWPALTPTPHNRFPSVQFGFFIDPALVLQLSTVIQQKQLVNKKTKDPQGLITVPNGNLILTMHNHLLLRKEKLAEWVHPFCYIMMSKNGDSLPAQVVPLDIARSSAGNMDDITTHTLRWNINYPLYNQGIPVSQTYDYVTLFRDIAKYRFFAMTDDHIPYAISDYSGTFRPFIDAVQKEIMYQLNKQLLNFVYVNKTTGEVINNSNFSSLPLCLWDSTVPAPQIDNPVNKKLLTRFNYRGLLRVDAMDIQTFIDSDGLAVQWRLDGSGVAPWNTSVGGEEYISGQLYQQKYKINTASLYATQSPTKTYRDKDIVDAFYTYFKKAPRRTA